jgi:hypothetical protein
MPKQAMTRTEARDLYLKKISACDCYKTATLVYAAAMRNLNLTNEDMSEIQTIMCQKPHYKKNDPRRHWGGF